MGESLTAFFISLIGIALFGLSAVIVWKQSSDFETTTGSVVAFVPPAVQTASGQTLSQPVSPSGKNAATGGGPERAAKIAFYGPDKQVVHFITKLPDSASPMADYKIGDRVTVLFQSNRPHNAIIYSFFDQWGASFLLFILSVPFLLLAYSLWLKIATTPAGATRVMHS